MGGRQFTKKYETPVLHTYTDVRLFHFYDKPKAMFVYSNLSRFQGLQIAFWSYWLMNNDYEFKLDYLWLLRIIRENFVVR